MNRLVCYDRVRSRVSHSVIGSRVLPVLQDPAPSGISLLFCRRRWFTLAAALFGLRRCAIDALALTGIDGPLGERFDQAIGLWRVANAACVRRHWQAVSECQTAALRIQELLGQMRVHAPPENRLPSAACTSELLSHALTRAVDAAAIGSRAAGGRLECCVRRYWWNRFAVEAHFAAAAATSHTRNAHAGDVAFEDGLSALSRFDSVVEEALSLAGESVRQDRTRRVLASYGYGSVNEHARDLMSRLQANGS